MSDFNRPDRHRLNRVNNRLEKALDELSRGVGEMRPRKFDDIRNTLQEVISMLERLQHDLVKHIASTDGTLPLDGDEESDDVDARPRKRAAAG